MSYTAIGAFYTHRGYFLRGEEDFADTPLPKEDYRKSIEHYTNALKYSDDVGFFRRRGQAYWEWGKLEEAPDDLRKALAYQKDNKELQEWVRYLSREKVN